MRKVAIATRFWPRSMACAAKWRTSPSGWISRSACSPSHATPIASRPRGPDGPGRGERVHSRDLGDRAVRVADRANRDQGVHRGAYRQAACARWRSRRDSGRGRWLAPRGGGPRRAGGFRGAPARQATRPRAPRARLDVMQGPVIAPQPPGFDPTFLVTRLAPIAGFVVVVVVLVVGVRWLFSTVVGDALAERIRQGSRRRRHWKGFGGEWSDTPE